MLTSISALNPLQVALVTALRADVGLQNHLHANPLVLLVARDTFKRVYDEGTVPADLTGRWLTLGDTSEEWARVFMRSGSTVNVLVHLWHTPVAGDDVGKAVAGELWAHVARVLSAPLVVTAHTHLRGSADLLSIAKDPDGRTWHGIARYRALTRVGP